MFEIMLISSQHCFAYFIIQILEAIHQNLYTDDFIKAEHENKLAVQSLSKSRQMTD